MKLIAPHESIEEYYAYRRDFEANILVRDDGYGHLLYVCARCSKPYPFYVWTEAEAKNDLEKLKTHLKKKHKADIHLTFKFADTFYGPNSIRRTWKLGEKKTLTKKRKCVICGTVFSMWKKYKLKTCSQDCHNEFRRITAKRKKRKSRYEHRKCFSCGELFEITKKSFIKTCSIKCRFYYFDYVKKNYNQLPEVKEKNRERKRIYQQTPRFKERLKKYRQTAKYQEYQKKWRESEKGKATVKRWKESDKGKETLAKYYNSDKFKERLKTISLNT